MGTGKGKDGKNATDSNKYVRYTLEQVEVLERIYNECPKPSSTRRQQLIKEIPILSNIGQKQLKVWFQNRRCREKQRKEICRLQNWNTKLNAMNQILVEENERLQKQTAQLISENRCLRQQLQMQQHTHTDVNNRLPQQVITATTDTSSESVVTSGQHQQSPLHQSRDTSLLQLLAIAEKTLTHFVAKATGSMVDWIQMPGMKPGPDSVEVVAVSRSWGGVAARACGMVGLEPFKVAEIVKNRSCWLEDCRCSEVLAAFNTDRGGLLELVHTQMYAPTTLAPARDFCTLRYTLCMEDGSLVICERSLTATHGDHISPATPGFVRTAMLPSGYLIRRHDSGGSIVIAVENLDFESESIPANLQPLYESSVMLVQKIAHRVLCHLQGVVGELKAGVSAGNHQSALLQGFSHRLVRGYNSAINCLSDDGWISISSDRPGTVGICMNPSPNCRRPGQSFSLSDSSPVGGGIICAKSSVLLQGVSPASFVQFMRDHHTAWTEICTGLYQGDMSGTSTSNVFSGAKYSSVQVHRPAKGLDEVLEVVRLETHKSLEADDASQHETFMLQLCTGLDESSTGGHAQLIFAPINASIPNNAPLLPSGFRIFCLNDCMDTSRFSRTLDLASTLESEPDSNRLTNSHASWSYRQHVVLTMAFQFMYEENMHGTIALKAQRYVQGLLDFVQTATNLLSPRLICGSDLILGSESFTLVCQIADSFRLCLGRDLLATNGTAEAVLKSFNSLKDAIVCCAWKPFPEFVFGNRAAMDMLETSPSALREISFEKMFSDGSTDYSEPPPFMHKEGYAHLPAGMCVTSTGRDVSFECATAWKVLIGDGKIPAAAFMFSNWSFVSVYY